MSGTRRTTRGSCGVRHTTHGSPAIRVATAVNPAWQSCVIGALVLIAAPAHALDKQGSAHGGDVQGADAGFDFTGSLTVGVSLYNPSYGARPDNTGLTLMRYAAHADVDLIGRTLSLPVDINMFTDRTREGAKIFSPTEFDVISGVTSTFGVGPGALEIGARVEHDRPLDTDSSLPNATQTYADVRARWLFGLADSMPSLGRALHGGDVSGYATLGWFAYNPSYFARPNNTGSALFRYVTHVEVAAFDKLFALGLDATFFTDRDSNAVRPSELDFTPELIFAKEPFEVHLAYERDMPVDGDGGGVHLVQQYLYLLAVYDFDLVGNEPPPLEQRGSVVSP